MFSTSEVHVRDRFDYWHDVACRSIVNHDSQPECRLTFNAAIQAGALADIGLVVFENSPMDISRTPGQRAIPRQGRCVSAPRGAAPRFF